MFTTFNAAHIAAVNSNILGKGLLGKTSIKA
jgi:hypothetical protein